MGIIHPLLKRYSRILIWILFCLAGIIVIKWKVIAGYTITTPSMEPTLIGNPTAGDRLAVFKPYYTFSDPSRFDVVVFFSEGNYADDPGLFNRAGGMRYIKRLAALPRETVLIKNGDLYLGTEPSRLVSKDLSTIEKMLIPLYKARFDETFFMDWGEFSDGLDDCFTMTSGGLLCTATSEKGTFRTELLYTPKRGAIYDDYLTDDGRLHEGRYPVNDLAIHLEFEPIDDTGYLFGELREAGDTFRFQLNSKAEGGGGILIHEVGSKVNHHLDIPSRLFAGLTPSRTYELTMMNVDNQVFLLLNGLLLTSLSYEENSDLFNSGHKNVPLIGAYSTRILFTKIEFDRDVYYCDDMGTYGVDQPYSVPEGQFFFLGDNSAESKDSRFYGAIPREDLIGKPFLIFYPFNRIGFF